MPSISPNDPVRQYLAAGIMGLAALVAAFLVVWFSVHGQPIPAFVTTLGGAIIGYAANALGYHSGATSVTNALGVRSPAQPPQPTPFARASADPAPTATGTVINRP